MKFWLGWLCRGSEPPLVDPAEPEGDDDDDDDDDAGVGGGDDDAGVGDDGDLHSNRL